MKMTGIIATLLASMMLLASCKLPTLPKNPGETDTTADTTEETTAETVIELNTPESTYDYSAGLDENGFYEGVKASEILTLPEYKGIELDKSKVEATEEALNEQLDMILAEHVTYEQITEGAIADGDTVNIDYVGSIDGVEFDGGSTGGMGTDVTIGVTQYIDDFLEQLIGHTPGENFDIEVTFPEDYGNEELNGKDAIFNITVNYIQGAEITPELNDEIAAYYGFETVDALIADINKWIEDSNAFAVFSEIAAGAECEEYPQSVIDYFINQEKSQIESNASMYGVTVDEFVTSFMGVESLDAYLEGNLEVYKTNALQFLAAQAIAELEGIVVTDADIEAAGYTDYIDYYGAPYVKQVLLFQEIIPQYIIENATIVG